MIMVTEKKEAFDIAYLMIDKSEYCYDENSSKNAGYPIYVAENNSYICDLDSRLEVNMNNGKSKNIWIQR